MAAAARADLSADLSAGRQHRVDVRVGAPSANVGEYLGELSRGDALARRADDVCRRGHAARPARPRADAGRCAGWPGERRGAAQPDRDAAVGEWFAEVNVGLGDVRLQIAVRDLILERSPIVRDARAELGTPGSGYQRHFFKSLQIGPERLG